MLEVTSLKVRTFDLDHLDIFWEIGGAADTFDRYAFYVLRSVDGAAGPYYPIAGPFQNTFQLRDPDVNQLNKWRDYFYKIKIVDKDSGEEREFGPEWHRAEPDLLALEMQRRHQLAFEEFIGRKVVLYPAITLGPHCPKCWDVGRRDNYIGRQKVQNCITCWDTGFLAGYGTPVLSHLQFDPSPARVQRTDTLELAPVDTTARASAFPPLHAHDIIVEAENVRWRIEKVAPTRKLRAVVHYELELHEIPRTDIRYKMPVNLDLLTSFAPGREFTRPMSLGNDVRTPIDDIFFRSDS